MSTEENQHDECCVSGAKKQKRVLVEETDSEGSEHEYDVSDDKKLCINIGFGKHVWTNKARLLYLQTVKSLGGDPMIKLTQNRDEESYEFDTILLNMTQWCRLIENDEKCFHMFAKNQMKDSKKDESYVLGYGIYEYWKLRNPKELQIRKMFLPANEMLSINWSLKENCDNVHKHLMGNGLQGISLNLFEYFKLRQYFNSDVMRKYIPQIDSYSPECKSCTNMPYIRKKTCMFCRYFTFNLEQ